MQQAGQACVPPYLLQAAQGAPARHIAAAGHLVHDQGVCKEGRQGRQRELRTPDESANLLLSCCPSVQKGRPGCAARQAIAMSGCQALPSAVQFAPEVAMSLKGMPTTSLAPSLRYNSLAVGQGRRASSISSSA